jgi:lactobin A/cerein 7B family class IIb bacteriocin
LKFEQVEDVNGGAAPLVIYAVASAKKIYAGYKLAQMADKAGKKINEN